MANTFTETVAKDLKEWTYSSTKLFFTYRKLGHKIKCFIVDKLLKVWFKIFGYPETFLVDNGGEFDNEDFRDFWENLSVRIKTAAESAWSDGLVERYNARIAEAARKTKHDIKRGKYSWMDQVKFVEDSF